jgi:glutamyl/glutaminyl-tRNA synthetase
VLPIQKVIWKDSDAAEARTHLNAVSDLLDATDFASVSSIKESIMKYAEAHGKGNVLWPLRMSLSGQEKSVDPFTIVYVLGKNESKARIENVFKALGS